MDDAQIYGGLTTILQDVLMRDDVVATPALRAADVPGWDSYKQVEIVLATEEHFGVKLTSREVDGLTSVGDLARLVAAKSA